MPGKPRQYAAAEAPAIAAMREQGIRKLRTLRFDPDRGDGPSYAGAVSLFCAVFGEDWADVLTEVQALGPVV